MALVDRIGQKFGDWVVVDVAPPKTNRYGLLCRCRCGDSHIVDFSNLFSGRSSRCQKCGKSRQRKNYSDARIKKLALAGIGFKVVRNVVRPLCRDCSRPISWSAVNGNAKCIKCAALSRVGVEIQAAWKYGRSLRSVAEEFGVSKQRVHQVVVERGWTAMLKYFRARKKSVDA